MHKLTRVFLVGVFSCLAWAAGDVTGKWTAEMAGRGGNSMTVTMNLKADGSKLSGTVSGRMGETEISDGKVDGDNVTFAVVREFNGNKITQNYRGRVNGDTIHFAVTIEGGPMNGGRAREFDATRSK
jgi:autotransporter translocation and assembly factor TamB